MKKIFFILGTLLACSFTAGYIFSETNQQSVWICSKSTTYHKTSSCIEIKNCTGTKKMISINEATKAGKAACGICYPQKKSQSTTKQQAVKSTKSTSTTNSNSQQATKQAKASTNSSQATKQQATKAKKK